MVDQPSLPPQLICEAGFAKLILLKMQWVLKHMWGTLLGITNAYCRIGGLRLGGTCYHYPEHPVQNIESTFVWERAYAGAA